MGSVLQKANVLANFELANPTLPEPKRRPDFDPRINHNVQHEESIQIRCANYLKREYPDVLFSSDAAGLKLKINQAKKWKAMNGTRGRPDMGIDYPSRGYHGLRIELKKEGTVIYKKDGTLRKQVVRTKVIRHGKLYIVEYDHLAEQAAMLAEYNRLGYFGRFVIGYDKFVQLLDWYMDRKTRLDRESEF